jgi:hypothetical protein
MTLAKDFISQAPARSSHFLYRATSVSQRQANAIKRAEGSGAAVTGFL